MNKKNNISDLKKQIEKIEKIQSTKKRSEREKGINLGFKVSTELLAALVVGVGIGLLVDNYFNSKPFGLIIFFILGALAGFLNVYRIMRRIEKQ